jgi:hypothetical protein
MDIKKPRFLIGCLLALVGLVLCYWNEERAITAHRSFDEGASGVMHTLSERVDPALEGKIVHVSGLAGSDEVLRDDLFGVTHRALRLVRHVEMYQWEETKKPDSNEVAYAKRWSPTRIDSSKFHESDAHKNPSSMPYDEKQWTTARGRVGVFALTPEAAEHITKFEPLAPTSEMLAAAPADTRAKFKIDGATLVTGVAFAPEVGDARVSFQVVRSALVSVVGKQSGGGITTAQLSEGRTLLVVEQGDVDEKTMLGRVPHEATPVFLYLRVLALCLLGIGAFLALYSPTVELTWKTRARLRLVTGLRATAFALAFALAAACAPWLAYKTWAGALMTVLAVACFGLGIGLFRKPA